MDQQLDVSRIVADLNATGVQADASPDVAELVKRVSEGAERNDLLLVMSNGAFGGFIPSLLDALRKKFGK
jgi:UDP-N-acetylmuramate: L-alanyl-gamma-D-glutamyl-meso-diaminopimelate ligase